MGILLKKAIVLFLCIFAISSYSQSFDFDKKWVSLGPNKMPQNPKYRGDAGVGPIEFVRVYQQKKDFLLAGSLHGGLFFSNNGGDSWANSGSDNWDYSGCAWADFYPADENIWFACSNISGDNGKPGKIGRLGGLLRTTNGGEDWQLIGDYHDFGQSENLKIYGTRFHPDNPNLIFVLTSEGLYFSYECLSDKVIWQRVPNVKGWVYDLEFMDGVMYATNFFHGDWNILQFDQDDYSQFTELANWEQENRAIRNLTIEPNKGVLVIAKDFTKERDEIIAYDPGSDSLKVILSNQRIGFGSGYAFAISPHDSSEFYLGYSTRVRKWKPPYNKMEPLGREYHVDVEFIAYDPFDSLKIYFATHGGVFISYNDGADWESKSENLGVAEVMGMDVHQENPNLVAIGCYHDGSMILADFNKTGDYYWRTVNGGDGLIPLFDPVDSGVVYTSNQFVGGGLYYSSDTAKQTKRNIHNLNNLKTAGWEMAAVLHPTETNTVYFNFLEKNGINKGNINICRTNDALKRKNAEIISDFNVSHKLRTYKVYGLYNSQYHPNVLIAYVLDYVKDDKGNKKTIHRLFRCDNLDASVEEIKASWYELKHPNNTWIGDVEIDGFNPSKIYLSYTRGKQKPDSMFGDRGMVYSLKYKDNYKHTLKREIDISKNIPNSVAGRYNLVYSKSNGGSLFIATQTGVFYGRNKTLKGRRSWREIGKGLPHCRIYGIDYIEKKGVITIGLFGRGVWQYAINK